MFKVAFHKQAVSAPLLAASDGDRPLSAHQLVPVIDSALQEVAGGAPKKLWISAAACCAFDPSAVTLANSSSDLVRMTRQHPRSAMSPPGLSDCDLICYDNCFQFGLCAPASASRGCKCRVSKPSSEHPHGLQEGHLPSFSSNALIS